MKLHRLLIVLIMILFVFSLTAQEVEEGTEDFGEFDAFLEDPFAAFEENSDDSGDLFSDPFADIEEVEIEPLDFSDPFGALDEEEDVNIDTVDVPEIREDEIVITLDDFDALFSQDMIEEAPDEDTAPNLAEALLESEGILWSGRYSGSLDFGVQWEDPWNQGIARMFDGDSVTPGISGVLRFNGRPDKDYRVAGKLSIETDGSFDLGAIDTSAFNVGTDDDGNFVIAQNTDDDEDDEDTEDEREIPDQSSASLTIGVDELFADFNYDSTLFFRFGKAFIKWGKGYFWSPADILNMSSIDAEDPTAERQGPVNLKMNYPFDLNNLNIYLLVDGAEVVEHMAVAANSEFVVGSFELGVGSYYKYDSAPLLVSTISGSLGDVGVFGEGVVSFGSDKVFVRVSNNQPEFEDDEETYIALDTYQIDWLPIFSATLGGMYMNSDLNLNIIGQYYFNGEGYSENTRFADGSSLMDNAAYLYNNADSNGLALADDEQGDDYEAPPELGIGDVTNFGQHYLGLSLSLSEVFDTDLGISVFWLGNLTDWSGMISPALSYELFDKATVNLSARMTYGESGDEYTNPSALFAQDEDESPQNSTLDVTLSFSLGGGEF